MTYAKLLGWSGLLNLFICGLLLVWWGLMGAMLISSGMLNIQTLDLVRLNGYQIDSLIGLLACVLAPVGLIGLYLPHVERVGKSGLAGCLLSCLGVMLYGCMQFDETFAWPVLALKAPALLGADGLMADPAYLSIFILMGLILCAGFILSGMAYWRAGLFPRWALVCFSVGAVLFGIGLAIPIRTLGLLLWVSGWGRMGYLQWKPPAQPPHGA